MRLPSRPVSGNVYQDFTGGGYFYLDDKNRAVLFTADHHISVVSLARTSFGIKQFRVDRDYDLTAFIATEDKGTSLLPDWAGRIWFVTLGGTDGVLVPETGGVQTFATGEEIENSFAVDETGGFYRATDVALYRFDPDSNDAPGVSWREVYQNTGVAKYGQVNVGTGTTLTLLGAEWVAIADNADPMNVVVYRRARNVAGSRLVCEQPVFAAGAVSGQALRKRSPATDIVPVVRRREGSPIATRRCFGKERLSMT